MKRTLVIVAALLFLLSLYYDLKVGTLTMIQPLKSEAATVNNHQAPETSYVEHLVKQGDTVISVVELYVNTPLPVAIETVVQDFISLNEIAPEKIQAGKVYKFPIYRD